MIRHVALFRFDTDLSEDEIRALIDGFEKIVDEIEGFIGVSGGANVSPEHLDHGFRHGIIADFEDAKALQRYLDHPAHRRHAARVLVALKGGVEQDVIAFDLQI